MDVSRRLSAIAHAAEAALRATGAHWLLARIAPQVPGTVQLPDGARKGPRQNGLPVFKIESHEFYDRLGADLKIGLGESYMAGDWHPGAGSDLADVLTPYAARLTDLVPAWMRTFRRLFEPLHPHHEENNPEGAQSHISRHYDFSNDLFAALRDEPMPSAEGGVDGDRERSVFGGRDA